jgi:hypothetical protein
MHGKMKGGGRKGVALGVGINTGPGEGKNQLLTQLHLINTSSSPSSTIG